MDSLEMVKKKGSKTKKDEPKVIQPIYKGFDLQERKLLQVAREANDWITGTFAFANSC
jgi:hypothetical protein